MAPLAPIALSLALQPLRFLSDAWADVQLQLTFENRGASPVVIYPGVALPWLASGWGGPQIALRGAGAPGGREPLWIELRTWYGPPGEPPATSYYERGRIVLTPGGRHQHVLPACWLPHRSLRAEQLAQATLDPEGMDGLARRLAGTPLANASALVVGSTCAKLRPRADSPDLLRGLRLGFFFGAGSYRLRATYAQEPWVAFEPTARVRVTSGWTELTIAE